ncbi:MAG: TonB-dependent receptor [Calditrichaeota bacterium]|nr:MAG: TonB-dependent receptor [Calditrichota bacterium]
MQTNRVIDMIHRSIVFLLLSAWGMLLFAQETGVIRGVITDEESGEPLIGVNVLVKGTYHGASSDIDGVYVIPDIQPGEYALEFSYVGYKVVQVTGVRVEPGQTVTVNVKMKSTPLALGQEVEVIGQRPLLDLEETSTVRTLSSEDINRRIVDDALELVAQQVGVVEQDNEIHIRGGRSYEAQYLLDGISVQDPLSGTGFGLNISANAIEEVEIITGGFKAEYGQATSGIVKVKTKSGGDKFEGFFSHKNDHLGLYRARGPSFNTDQYEFNLSGPEPLTGSLLPGIGIDIPGKMYFFFNIYAFLSDDYTRATSPQLHSAIAPRLNLFGSELFSDSTLAPRQNNNWSLLFKLTWKLNPTNVITYSYNRSLAINQNTQSLQTTLEFVEPNPGFPYDFSKNLANFNTYTHDNEQAALSWQHTLNKTTFFELRASRYFAHLRSDWNGHHWRDYIRAVDVARLPVQYFFPDSESVRVIPGDGFFDYGNASFWHDHYVESYTFKGDLTYRRGDIHTFKGGFEASFREMQLIDIADPWVGDFGSSQDIYRVHPSDGALYVQDDIRFKGFYVNAGVRLDYWAPGALADRAVQDTTTILTEGMRKKYLDESFGIFGRRVKLRLMPRLGVSFPISNNQMLYFNYGHFSKLPRPQFVYAKLGPTSSRSAFQKFGNPSLNPETSVKYELGVRHKFTENDVLSITAFYKDIFDYVQSITIPNLPRIGRGITYVNLDYARSRGMEIEYKTRIGDYFHGSLSGSYSITTTKSSTSDIAFLVANRQLTEPPIKEVFARWDRPWQVSANLGIRIPRGHHPKFLGIRLFDDWSLSARFFAQAGKRYTPTEFFGFGPDGRPLYASVQDQSKQYSKVAKAWQWTDVNFVKNFRIGGLKYAFEVEVRNLFSNKNPQIINPVTGDAYHFGDPVPSSWNDPLFPDRDYPISSPFPLNPARYRAPRNIRFGISVQF